MHLSLSAFVFALFIGAEPVAKAASLSQAVVIARQYSAALVDSDCSKVLELASPALTRRLHRDPDGETGFCEYVLAFRQQGVSERFSENITSLSNGKFKAVFIETTRTANDPSDKRFSKITQGTYVVHSSDSGTTWHVLDFGCVDQRWVREVYPHYRGKPMIHRSKYKRVLTTAQ